MILERSDKRYMLLAWPSQKLKKVVKSTLTALQEIIEVACIIRCLLLEILKLEQ